MPKIGILAGQPEIVGTRCMDGSTCHESCKSECFRKANCHPLTSSGLAPDWSLPTANPVFNGIRIIVDTKYYYRNYVIVPKLDMGRTPWILSGAAVDRGYVITQDNINVVPGAAWFVTVESSFRAIDALVESKGDVELFWKLFHR